MSLYQILLFLHILLSIAVLGPSFSFPIWTAQARKDPRHRPFVLSVFVFLSEKWIVPGSILLFLSGVALMILGNWNLFTAYWLDVAIVLFLINFFLGLWVVKPITLEMLRLSQSLGQNPADTTSQQKIQALAKRQSRIGIFSTISLILIVYLMVAKPF